MYRVKVTGYVQYLEGEDPYTSLQNREYGKDFEASCVGFHWALSS